MRRAFLFSMTLLLFAQHAAVGCLNDSELPDREREFRSQYLDSELHLTTTSQPEPTIPNTSTMNSIIGVVLMAGALGMTILSRK